MFTEIDLIGFPDTHRQITFPSNSLFCCSDTQTTKMKKTVNIILVIAAVVILGGLTYMFVFFKKNDAPALHGELEYNIEFKEGLKLDVYQPTKQVYEKNPVVVYIHGGAWISGSKMSVNNARFNGAFNTLREKGYAIVAPDYTLAKFEQSPFPACLADAVDAMSWISNHAEEYNFDLDNVGLLGESAGAHISMMTVFYEDQTFAEPHDLSFTYLIDVYGPSDLYQLYKAQIPLIDSINSHILGLPEHIKSHLEITEYLFGFDPAEDTSKTAAFTGLYSPVHKLTSSAPNILMIHGNVDQVVPLEQSHILKAAMDSMGVYHEFHVLEGVDHAFLNATEEQMQQTQEWISEFVVRHYQGD